MRQIQKMIMSDAAPDDIKTVIEQGTSDMAGFRIMDTLQKEIRDLKQGRKRKSTSRHDRLHLTLDMTGNTMSQDGQPREVEQEAKRYRSLKHLASESASLKSKYAARMRAFLDTAVGDLKSGIESIEPFSTTPLEQRLREHQRELSAQDQMLSKLSSRFGDDYRELLESYREAQKADLPAQLENIQTLYDADIQANQQIKQTQTRIQTVEGVNEARLRTIQRLIEKFKKSSDYLPTKTSKQIIQYRIEVLEDLASEIARDATKTDEIIGPRLSPPTSRNKQRKQEQAVRIIQEGIAREVAHSTSILEEGDRYKSYVSGKTIAALKSELRPVRLVTSQDSNWGLRLAMDTIAAPVAKEYEQWAREQSIEIPHSGRVRHTPTSMRGIAAFATDKLNLSNVQSVRDNADEIEQIARDLIKPSLNFFLDRMREQAKKVYHETVTGPNGGVKYLENRERFIKARYLHKKYSDVITPELMAGANRAIEQIRQTKQAYVERAQEVYQQTISEYSSAALLDGLFNSQLKTIFTLSPSGRPAKKLTEKIIQGVLEQALSDIRQTDEIIGPRLAKSHRRSSPLSFQLPQRKNSARSGLYTALTGV